MGVVSDRKKAAGKAHAGTDLKSVPIHAMMKDEAQRSIRTFYEAVGDGITAADNTCR